MSFQIPDDVKLGKVGGPALAKTTLALYKGCLNKISAFGYSTREDLQNNQSAVVEAINQLLPGDEEKIRANKRKFYSAIFWILSDDAGLESKQTYYNEFQKVKQNYQASPETLSFVNH